jgi:hypothetical protein
MDDKKDTNKLKSLTHYYNNLEYYRNYYKENKDKLLEYSKQYKKKLAKPNEKKIIINNRTVLIQKGKFIVTFD